MLTAAQCRAARALLGMEQRALAARAGMSVTSLTYFENRRTQTMLPKNLKALRRILEEEGVIFVWEDGPAGIGVRLTKEAQDRLDAV